MTTESAAREAARELIKRIGANKGHITPEDERNTPSSVLAAVKTLRGLAASSINTLAKNLYTSKARFLFELLQNAEDNDFTKAENRNETPYVAFHIFPDRIVQECNEDGFAEHNIQSICSVGQSSKQGAQGYVGEKGIGFKSVFMVADKVEIQSGDYSFYFHHPKNDPGLGMVTPIWLSNRAEISSHLTRITLYLHTEGDAAEIAKERRNIRLQFEDIHDNILLFMRHLAKIDVIFHDRADDESIITNSISLTIDRKREGYSLMRKITNTNDHRQVHERVYQTIKHVVADLAKSDNRTYSKEEEASKAYATSEIILAFPLDSADAPKIDENEWVFAFLPMAKLGFKFVVQADFVTEASRQGVVTDSSRNEGISDGIAEAFILGILKMCEHPTLKYQWMRFLPKQGDFQERFWLQVVAKIESKLATTPILVPEIAGISPALKLIKDSRMHSSQELDSKGRVLFRDTTPARYLSSNYDASDLMLLASQGLECMSMREIVHRVEWDLEQVDSRIKTATDNAWQSRAARLLCQPFIWHLESSSKKLKSLKLVPLRSGKWAAISELQKVYFPRTSGTVLDVPSGLDLNVVCPSAVENGDRKILFDFLGVIDAQPDTIREAIITLHETRSFNYCTIRSLIEQVRFLYLTEDPSTHSSILRYEYNCIELVNRSGQLLDHAEHTFYFQDDNPYGAATLLKDSPFGESESGQYNVNFLHGKYFQDAPRPSHENQKSFNDWLKKYFHVRDHLPIVDKKGTALSEICLYLATQAPSKFLDFLRTNWVSEKPRFNTEKSIIEKLGEIPVSCGKSLNSKMVPLRRAYLPLEPLQELTDRFLEQDEFFPFLLLESPLSNGRYPLEWKAIGHAFGIGMYRLDSVDFILDILKAIFHANQRYSEGIDNNKDEVEDDDADSSILQNPKRILDLYTHLHIKSLESTQKDSERQKIREFFKQGMIYIPSIFSNNHADWVLRDKCVWEAPSGINMITLWSLSDMYSTYFPELYKIEKPRLKEFFSDTLEVRLNCTPDQIIKELRMCRTRKKTDLDILTNLYQFLDLSTPDSSEAAYLKQAFGHEKLIYGGVVNQTPTWYRSQECLWSSPTNIKGMFIVNSLYEDLDSFFIDRIGVETRTAQKVYEKLLLRETTRLPVTEIKQTILAFSALLGRETCGFDPVPLMDAKIFPVRLADGKHELRTGLSSFFIRDRDLLGEYFVDKAVFLDFSMDEVRDLQGFFQWTGLTDRYLSVSVKEVPSVDVDSTRPISNQHFCIASKAYALVRIAKHFRSVRVQDGGEQLYRLLRSSETLETDKITSVLHLSQDGRAITVERQESLLYIREQGSSLKVYVPRDETTQETCFRSKLPLELCMNLMADSTTLLSDSIDSKAVRVVQSILGARHRALPAILEEFGIVSLDFADEDENYLQQGQDRSETDSLSVSYTHEREEVVETAASARLVTTNTLSSPAPSPLFRTSPARPYSSEQRDGRYDPAFTSLPELPIRISSTNGYAQLLRKVVDEARRGSVPMLDASTVSSRWNINSSEVYDLRNFQKLERDRRVGAAGELYVFELLTSLQSPHLPNFTRHNWRSTIRHYVDCHPEYADIGHFSGPETSDIVYTDESGTLTQLLISKGYLRSDIWAGAKVNYSIEVKTTTEKCSAPFYMNRNQYNKMQKETNLGEQVRVTDTLYVIFRVYNLGQNDIGLRVLMDPERLRQSGQLMFSADTWSVVVED